MAVPRFVEAAVNSVNAAVDQDISKPVRNKKLHVIRGKALSDHLRGLLVQSRKVELGEYTVHIETASVDPVTGLVELTGVRVYKGDDLLELDPHRFYLNPPLLFPDESGDVVRMVRDPGSDSLDSDPPLVERRFRVDPAAAILVDILGSVEE